MDGLPLGGAPPQDMDAEAAILGGIFTDASVLDQVALELRADHFYADANRLVYEACLALQLAGHKPDIVLVASYLRDRNRLGQVGGGPYLAQLADATPIAGQLKAYCDIVRDKWRLRQLISAAKETVVLAYAPVENAQQLLEQHEQKVAELSHQGEVKKVEAVRTIGARVLENMRAARERGDMVMGIRTGLGAFDQMTGGLFTTDLNVVAARPGMGKTAFALSIACHIARPKRRADDSIVLGDGVLFCTLEQPREQLVQRIAAHEGDFDSKLWRSSRLREEDWTTLKKSWFGLEKLPIFIDDTPMLTLLQLRAKVRALKREISSQRTVVESNPLKVVIVDYLQLMQGVRERGDSREREIASLSAGLKNLAKQENLVIIAVSQLNRALESQKDKRPALKDLRESGAIEQDADNVYFLYRESYYDRAATDQRLAVLDIAKQRNGSTGSIELSFKKETGRFTGLIDSEYYDDGYFDQYDAVP